MTTKNQNTLPVRHLKFCDAWVLKVGGSLGRQQILDKERKPISAEKAAKLIRHHFGSHLAVLAD